MRGLVVAAALLASTSAMGQIVSSGSTGAVFHPGYVANNWYSPYGYNPNAPAPAAVGAGVMACSYGAIFQPVTINTLGSRVSTLSAGGNVQFAVYANGSWGRPSAPVVSTGNVSTAATGIVSSAVAASLAAGSYWFCQNADNGTVVMAAQAANTVSFATFYLGSAGQAAAGTGPATPNPGISVAQAFGTWPTWTSATAWTEVATASAPYVGFKVASSP
jgi:hypothetical protein